MAILTTENFNVMAFGAIGNAVEDDTAAIQAAIDAAEEQGGNVVFPPGQYNITSTLTVAERNAVSLEGLGSRTVVDYDLPNANVKPCIIVWKGTSGGTMLDYRGSGGKIDNITLWGKETGDATRAGAGLAMTGTGVVGTGHCQIGALDVHQCDTGIQTTGTLNSADISCQYLRVTDCTAGIDLNNVQSMNWTFQFVSMQAVGTCFKIQKGGNLSCQHYFGVQTPKLLHLVGDGTGIGANNASFWFGMVAFDASQTTRPMLVDADSHSGGQRQVTFGDIRYPQTVSDLADNDPLFRLKGELHVRVSHMSDVQTGKKVMQLDGGSGPTSPSLTIEQSSIRGSMIEATFATITTPGASVPMYRFVDCYNSDINGELIGSRSNNLDAGWVNVKGYGATGDGTTNDTTAIQAAITAAGNGTVYFPAGTYLISEVYNDGTNLVGDGILATTLKAAGSTHALKLGQVTDNGTWNFRRIEKMTIDGNAQAADGVTFEDETDARLAGRWTFHNCRFQNCNRGIHKPTGNIGNSWYDCQFYNCDFGYHATSNVAPLMHAGNDSFNHCHFMECDLAAIYINSPAAGTGNTIFRDTIVEGNEGFGLFVKEYNTSKNPLALDSCWFEGNATAGSVTIDAVPYTPKTVYLKDCDWCILDKFYLRKTEIINSRVHGNWVAWSSATTPVDIDATSVVVLENAFAGGSTSAAKLPATVRSLSGFDGTQTANSASVFRAVPYSGTLPDVPGDGRILWSNNYRQGDTVFVGTGNLNGTRVADGRLFASCTEWDIPTTYVSRDANFTVTSGLYYVTSVDIKLTAGNLSDLQLRWLANTSLGNDLDLVLVAGQWVRVVTCTTATATNLCALRADTTGPVTLRVSAAQVAEFSNEHDAVTFFNSLAFAGDPVAGEAWNETHLRMGDYHLWVDSTGDLRIKSGAPTGDTDGTVVGTQT